MVTCEALEEIAKDGPDQFFSDFRSQWAVAMGFIRLGEDSSRLSGTTRERFSAQPWRRIIGLRNLAAHQYDKLATDLMWRTLTQEVPALHRYITSTIIPVLRREGSDRH